MFMSASKGANNRYHERGRQTSKRGVLPTLVYQKATRQIICYRDHHLHQSDTNMDDLRDSISKLKKGIRHGLGKSKRKANEPGASGREEGVDSSSSLPQSEPRVTPGSGREREGSEPNAENESVGPSAAVDENRPDWKSSASSSAKLLLRAVRDSADAFGPLKSVAGGLCFILENLEVRHPSAYAIHNTDVSAENKGKQTGYRVVGTPGPRTCRTTL